MAAPLIHRGCWSSTALESSLPPRSSLRRCPRLVSWLGRCHWTRSVEDIGSVSALAKAAPSADDEVEVLSVALWAIAPVPLLITVADRSPEELGRFCLVRTGEVVSARRALLLSLCPRWCSWPGLSISIIPLFVPFLEDMLVVLVIFMFSLKTKDKKCTS